MRQHINGAMIRQGGVFLCLLLLISACSVLPSPSADGNLTPFVQDGSSYNGGQWSPSGQWFAAAVYSTNTIHLFSPNGQLIHTITNCVLSGSGTDFAWTPDNQLSCLTAYPRQLQLLTLTPKGEVQQIRRIPLPTLPEANEWNFQWNPRHFWFAILAEPVPGDGDSSLYISDGNGHTLLAPWNAHDAPQLAWSPDGKTLALTEPTGDILLLSFHQTATGQLTIVQTRDLHADVSYTGNIAWSPSGRWLVCRHGSYNSEDYLFLLATDGSGKQVQITSSTTDGQLDFPAWSPDGKQLVVAQIAITGNTLMTFNIEQVLKEKGVQP
ncbi:MAG TPA: hypothetical protein VNG51_15410 [Ktedonobacteraceae bacterium]|nr:hypothetical protein [Ktedonobacteraceae bacterium]